MRAPSARDDHGVRLFWSSVASPVEQVSRRGSESIQIMDEVSQDIDRCSSVNPVT